MGTTTFNAMEIDAIGEIMNISIGASATAVSTMLGTTTNITTPIVSVETRSQFSFKDLEPAIGVEISYVKGLSGRNVMMFSRDDVRVIVGMMMGQEIPPEEFEMDELNASAIREVMNMMMGSSATALSEFLGYAVDISTPVSFEIKNAEDFKNKYFPNDEPQVVVRFSLEIGDKLSSEFLNIMGIDLAKKLLEPYADSLGMGSDDAGQTADAAAQANASAGTADAGAAADTAAQAAAEPNAAAQAAPDQTAEPNAAAQDQTPGAAEAQSMPAGNQADTAAASSGSGEKLDQAATDALLASLKAQNSAGGTSDSQSAAMNDDKYGQPEQNISDEDAKAQYEAMTKGQRPLSQGETDALLASLKQQAASDTLRIPRLRQHLRQEIQSLLPSQQPRWEIHNPPGSRLLRWQSPQGRQHSSRVVTRSPQDSRRADTHSLLMVDNRTRSRITHRSPIRLLRRSCRPCSSLRHRWSR